MTSDAVQRGERLSTPVPSGPAQTIKAAEAAPDRPRPRRAAVIAVHGMGQQNRFDTITAIGGRLYDMADGASAGRRLEIVNRRLGEGRSQMCCEFNLPTTDAERAFKEVSVFEVYWAPLTEGKIGFWETVWFLFVSALWGAWLTLKDAIDLRESGFRRWIFGRAYCYEVSWATLPLLAVTFAGVFGIICIMVGAFGALAAKFVAAAIPAFLAVPIAASSPVGLVAGIDVLQTQFTSILLTALVLGLAVSLTFALAGRLISSSRLVSVARMLLMILTISVALAAGLCGLALAGLVARDTLPFLFGSGRFVGLIVDRARDVLGLVDNLPGLPPKAAIPLNLAFFWVVYFFAKQYVGDVAIYVSAHRVNRYWETRETIRDAAHQVAKDVYQCRDEDGFRYDEIYFVAHSLGSVVAYDTINAILRDELVLQQPIDAVGRTKGLLTYGAPLDKTAFLFRAYSSMTVERLAAVAAWQPLILSEAFRTLKWVNIYSSADPISAPLEYYGIPGRPEVINRRDEQSYLPLVAHVEYEKHEAFRTALCELLGARRKPADTRATRSGRRTPHSEEHGTERDAREQSTRQ